MTATPDPITPVPRAAPEPDVDASVASTPLPLADARPEPLYVDAVGVRGHRGRRRSSPSADPTPRADAASPARTGAVAWRGGGRRAAWWRLVTSLCSPRRPASPTCRGAGACRRPRATGPRPQRTRRSTWPRPPRRRRRHRRRWPPPAPLQSHEVFGYAPYWTLPQSSGFDVKDLTTLAYFSVDANADGTLDQSGSGWNGYESQDLVNLVTRSHAAGDRVVLTVTCFNQHSLDAITSDPNAPARLSAALISAVQAKNLDGVNFDFEGEGSADQVGLTNLITKVSAALHAADPHWQVTMAVYASAASDSARLLQHRRVGPGTRRVLRHGLRHELEVPAECHLATVRRQLQRRPGHRGVPARWCRPSRSSSGCPTTATTGRRPGGR